MKILLLGVSIVIKQVTFRKLVHKQEDNLKSEVGSSSNLIDGSHIILLQRMDCLTIIDEKLLVHS